MTTAAQIIAAARAGDDANAGIVNLLTNDSDLERLVAVWASVPVPRDPDPSEVCPPDLPAAVQLRWVWSRLEPDPVQAWIALSGLPDAPYVRRTVALAMDNRVVFPDGGLSTWAEVYIQQQARRALGIRAPRAEQETVASAQPSAPEPSPEPPAEPPPRDPLMLRPRRRRSRRSREGV